MASDQTIGLANVTQTNAGAATSPAKASSGLSFRALLSDLNPLQYIPVVGSIYRAITGDEGNASLRFVASLGTSFALGGPIGVGITVAEKVTGIDPEKIGRHLLASLFHHGAAASTTVGNGGSETATMARSSARPWTEAELAAYGVKSNRDGELIAGTLSSADVLNTLELHRLSTPTYA